METSLDRYDELLLDRVEYEDKKLYVSLQGSLFNEKLSQRVRVVFDRVFAVFVLEEAADAVTYTGLHPEPGYIKRFPQKMDPLEATFAFTAFAPDANLAHFRVITRHDVVHIISSDLPLVEQVE
jgi:hypothetical protein